jgi:hypothetical protein
MSPSEECSYVELLEELTPGDLQMVIY